MAKRKGSHSKEIQRLARRKAAKEKELRDLKEAHALFDEYTKLRDRIVLTDVETFLVASPYIAALYSRMVRLSKLNKEIPEMEEMMKGLKELANDYKELVHELERGKKLRKREPEKVIVMPQRMCVACGKKPARIDNLCKVCAREQGIVVRGKI